MAQAFSSSTDAYKGSSGPARQNTPSSSSDTDVQSPERRESRSPSDRDLHTELAPIKPAPQRPNLQNRASTKRQYTEADLFRTLSRRDTATFRALVRQQTQASIKRQGLSRQQTEQSEKRQGLSRQETDQNEQYQGLSQQQTQRSENSDNGDDGTKEEMEEIFKLLSNMFGRDRQEHSEEQLTRHVGVSWKDLTVKGVGLGAAIQPTLSAPFYAIKTLLTKGPKAVKQKPPVRTLINGFSGCIKPGEMLLVLGRPGSGCSTFLKSLANQRSGFEDVSGEVLYGGTDHKTMQKKYRGEILYNPEDDLHYATISVKDTLTFALKTRTPGKNSRVEGESKQEYVSEFLRMVTKLFWIEHTLNTKVGNELIRGVSGGEKKRVSIAEAMITKASIQCWDGSTKGLDSSTAKEYVESLRALTNMTHISTAAALYQVGESLYNLFDKVILIHEGECAYFGPTDHAAQYFKDLGFVQPERWTTADFLTSVVDDHQRHIKDGCEEKIPRSGAQFGEMFRNSDTAKNNVKDMEELEEDVKEQAEHRHEHKTKETKKKNYTIPFYQQVLAVTQRQAKVMLGDPQALGGKWFGIGFQSLIVGSLFFQLPATSAGVFPRGGVIFFMLLFNSLLALSELTSAFESRPILMKHKSFSFYRPAAYAIAQTVIDVPLVFVQVFIFDIVVYWMAGLSATPSQFFISLLFLWIITMTIYALFRSVGSLLGSLDASTRVTGVLIQALVVYIGYLIPPAKMHPWFSWLRWINPLQYGFEALLVNEFYKLDITCQPPFLVPQGPMATTQYQSCTIQGSTPGSNIVRGENYVEQSFGYKHSHIWRNFGIICAMFLFFVTLTAVGLESQKPNKGGGAITVFKRGEAPQSVAKAMTKGTTPEDEESGKHEPNAEKDKEAAEEDKSDNDKGLSRNETIFTWSGVNYSIPYEHGTRKLLQNQQGYVRPGKLTALMGSSGAGKTTLLNTLAQRITFGTIRGEFLVDGNPLPKSFQRSSGFAQQDDIHEPTATVREALQFSAKLRQPREVSLEEKYEYVEKVIDLLEMRDIAGATVGVSGAGLNQEQRKRLTIGVELASKPELLMFLDEPTSGLDSGAAFNIVRILRKLAASGQAILCTIHQPSSVLFEHFDELILLESGGRLVYHGELGKDSKTLIKYFERNSDKKCYKKSNPAEWMLEVIGAGNPDYQGKDFGDVWEASEESSTRSDEIKKMNEDRRNASNDATKDDRPYAMPLTTQIREVTLRRFRAYWRTPDYIIGKFMLHIVTGLFNTFTFYKLGNSQIDMQSRLFSIFLTLTIAPPLVQQLQPKYLEIRGLYQSRESSSKIYSWWAFVVSAIVPELPYSLVAGTLYWCCWYWGVGFPRGTYTSALVWMFIECFELFYVGFGMAIASFSPNALLASLLVPVFFTFITSFCGVVVPAMGLPHFWHAWMYWLTPFHYLLEGLLGLVVHNVPVQCQENELARFSPPPGLTCQQYAGPYSQQAGGYVETLAGGLCGFCQYANGDQFARNFSVYYSHHWRNYGIFWLYIIFNFGVVILCSYLYLSGGRRVKSFFSPVTSRIKALIAKTKKKPESEKELGWPTFGQ